MESWIACSDVDVASAFMTMGVVMKPVVQVRADNGKEYVTMYLSTTSVTMPELNVGHLMKALMSGELQKLDPHHELLGYLMAIKNRHAAKRALDSAERQVLITRKGTTRTAYVRESITNKGMEMADRFLATGRP